MQSGKRAASLLWEKEKVEDMKTGKDFGLKTVTGTLLTPKEVAGVLRVSERWVQQAMKEGTLPIRWYFVSERDRLIDSRDLDDFLANVRISAGEKPLPLKAERKVLTKGEN